MNALYNLARVTTATVGTGTITLGAAVSGFLTFAQAGVPNAAVVTYAIADGANSEIGTGTYTLSGTTLSRDTVLRSTGAANTGKITLSGSAQVFISPAAEDFSTITGVTLALSSTTAGSLTVGQTGLLIGGIQNAMTLSGPNGYGQARFSAATTGPIQRFGKSRGTFAAAAAVAAGDMIFRLEGYGDDGATNGDITVNSAVIRVMVEGTVSAGVVPTNVNIQTMNAGGTLAERIRLHASGGLSLGNTTDPGAANLSVTGSVAAAASGSNLGDQIRPNYVTCTTQLDKTSNTTLATATGLTVTLVAGKTYAVEGWLSTTAGASGGLKIALVAAASLSATSCRFQALAFNGTTLVANTTVTALGSNIVANTAVITDVYIKGSIVVNAGGTINVQMAQNVSNGTPSSIFAGSDFSAVRIN